jgi:hypothetical protein
MSRGNFKFSVGKIIRVLTLGTKNGRISWTDSIWT